MSDLYEQALDVFPTLRARGLTAKRLREFGVEVTKSLQLLIPLYDPFGERCGVLIRTRYDKVKYYSEPAGAKQYLYNLFYSDGCGEVLVLFESPFDVMATDGFQRAALLGLKLTDLAIATLEGLGCTHLILAFDLDVPGQVNSFRIARELVEHGFCVCIYTKGLQIQDDYDFVRDYVLTLERPAFLVV